MIKISDENKLQNSMICYQNILLDTKSVTVLDVNNSKINFDSSTKIKNVFENIEKHCFSFKDFISYKEFIDDNLQVMFLSLCFEIEKLDKIVAGLKKIVTVLNIKSGNEEVFNQLNKDTVVSNIRKSRKSIKSLKSDYITVINIAKKVKSFYGKYVNNINSNSIANIDKAILLAIDMCKDAKDFVSRYNFNEALNLYMSRPILAGEDNDNILAGEDNDNILAGEDNDNILNTSTALSSPRGIENNNNNYFEAIQNDFEDSILSASSINGDL